MGFPTTMVAGTELHRNFKPRRDRAREPPSGSGRSWGSARSGTARGLTGSARALGPSLEPRDPAREDPAHHPLDVELAELLPHALLHLVDADVWMRELPAGEAVAAVHPAPRAVRVR